MPLDLSAKLQIQPDHALLVLHAPSEQAPDLDNVSLTNAVPASAVLVFITQLADTTARFSEALANLRPGGLLWVAYPKGSSGWNSDVNRDRLWKTLEPTGWRPVRQVAINAVWSAMRFKPADQVTEK